MSDFPLNPESYELLNIIGKGDYSKVYEAKCKTNGKTLCIKIVNLEEFPLESLQKTTAFWSKCNDPDIVKYYGSFLNHSSVWILEEFMDAGSLEDIIKYGFSRGIHDENVCANIISGALKGLNYFHKNQQIHRNIKSCNILINSKGESKIADFGLATSMIQGGTKKAACFSMYGDACYMSPEILMNGDGYSPKSDIWSLGLTSIEIATGKMPYEGVKIMQSIVNIMSKEPPSLPDNPEYSPAFQDFVNRCLCLVPEKRATAEELLNHRFIKSARNGAEATAQILKTLPPLSERFKSLYPDDTKRFEQNNAVESKKEKTEFTFDIQDEESKLDQPIRVDKVPERVGRFNIQRTSSKSMINGPFSSSNIQPPKKQSAISQGTSLSKADASKKIRELANEIKTLSSTLDQLETEHDELEDKLSKMISLVQNLSSSTQ